MSERQKAVQACIARLVPEEIRAMSAYHVADARGLIKLDAMENPYDWPPALVSEWLERLRGVRVNRYPDPGAGALKARLRDFMDIPGSADILLGNGSDELIQLLVLAIGGAGSVVLAPDPSFAMYRLVARATGRRFVGVALDRGDFSLDVEAMRSAIREHDPALVFLAYPNNPTGNLFERRDVEAVLAASRGVVVVDEAYAPFAGKTFLPALDAWPNLLVLRTVSKLGLAGLRLGVLAGDPAWLAELDKLRLPYNLNVLTQVSAEFLLGRGEVFEAQTQRICRDRITLQERLAAMPGIRVWPSHANFLLVRCESVAGSRVAASLREQGVLVKDLHGASPLLESCLRVTVGRPEENDALLAALAKALA